MPPRSTVPSLDVHVEVVQGRGFPSLTHTLDLASAPQLYLTLRLGRSRAVTSLVRACKEPEWRDVFAFKVRSDVMHPRDPTRPSKDALLEFDLYTCDAYKASPDLLEQRIRSDGPHAARPGPAREVQNEQASPTSLDEDEKAKDSYTHTAVPLPIRPLAKGAVLLQGLPKHRSASRTDWIDLIPKERVSSRVPLFIFGQLGVRAYIVSGSGDTEGEPSGESSIAAQPHHIEQEGEQALSERSSEHSSPVDSGGEDGSEVRLCENGGNTEVGSGDVEGTGRREAVISGCWRPCEVDWSALSAYHRKSSSENIQPLFAPTMTSSMIRCPAQAREVCRRDGVPDMNGVIVQGSNLGWRAFGAVILVLVLALLFVQVIQYALHDQSIAMRFRSWLSAVSRASSPRHRSMVQSVEGWWSPAQNQDWSNSFLFGLGILAVILAFKRECLS